MRLLILFIAESFVTRHIKIGGTLKIITKNLDMAARGTHDSEISKKCAHLRPFSLLKSGIRAYTDWRVRILPARSRHSPTFN
jgi:hypothetical protein